jgi:chromosome segregation ATPase
MSSSNWELQMLDQQIRDKEREIAAIQQELAAFDQNQRSTTQRIKGVFDAFSLNPVGGAIFDRGKIEDRLRNAQTELTGLRAKRQSLSRAQHLQSLPDVIERLQSLIHELLSALPSLEAGGVMSMFSMFAGADDLTSNNEAAAALRGKARSLLPAYIAGIQTLDSYSIAAELRKYESYRDELASEISRHESIVSGTVIQTYITPLKEQKQLLYEIALKLDSALKRKQQQTKVPQSVVADDLNSIVSTIRTMGGVNAACDALIQEFPEHKDFINRERRRVLDRLRDK